MTPTNKCTALAIGGMMAFGLLIASSAFAQTTSTQPTAAPTTSAQATAAQKQRTQGGPDCDFSVAPGRLSPDCQNIKKGLDAAKGR
jgi:hypothetical protein